MEISVVTVPFCFRSYSTALMSIDGWKDSRGDNHYPTVSQAVLSVGRFLDGEDDLYLDVYYHDDKMEMSGGLPAEDPVAEPELVVRKKILDRSMARSVVYLKVDEVVVIDSLNDVLPLEGALEPTVLEEPAGSGSVDPSYWEPDEDPSSEDPSSEEV